jgi:hypothetical protein
LPRPRAALRLSRGQSVLAFKRIVWIESFHCIHTFSFHSNLKIPMAIINSKPIPAFTILNPAGEFSIQPPVASLRDLMWHDHVVEFSVGPHMVRMHHWDRRKQGAAPNPFATSLLQGSGVVQIKGQRRKEVYGDAYLMHMQAYPYIRTSMPAADLEAAITTYLPGVETIPTLVAKDIWDVFITAPDVTESTLVAAAMALG